MASMTDGYPFIFQMNDRNNADDVLEYTLQCCWVASLKI